MAKRYDEPIEVTVDERGLGSAAPLAFRWRGRAYEIDERLESWRAATQWWDRDEVREREYHRVLARPAGALASGDIDPDGFMRSTSAVYDIYLDRIKGTWRLARLWD